MQSTEKIVTLSTPDVDLHVQYCGDAPRAVFLHGFGGDLHDFDRIWPQLAGRLPALRYDRRGFGASASAGNEPFDHGADLLALLDALDIERADLVGLSEGGAIALHFALDHPDRVRRLVLVSPGMVAWEWSDEWRGRWREIVDVARAGDMPRARELWWHNPLFATTRECAAANELHATIQRYSGAQWLRDAQRPALPDVERLHRLAAPTLLLTGALDLPDFRLIASLIEAAAPDVRRVDFPHLGHLVHMEDPAACAGEIGRFLAAP